MGFFDKAKNFMGGHGLKVQLVEVERQDPTQVALPIADSVLKGKFDVVADKDCVVLKHVSEFILVKKHPDGREETVVLGSDRQDEKTEIIGSDHRWPYNLGAGQSRTDWFIIGDVDIPGTLRRLGYADPFSAAGAPELKFLLKVSADVKGSPFDPTAETAINITP